MAVYIIFPEKDTFISSEVPTGNAGKDEIVEIGGYTNAAGIGETSRVLVQYSTSAIQDVIANKIGISTYSASINLYLADAYEIPVNYTLYAYPVYGSWDNGVGKFGDTPVNTSGVSWQYKLAGEAEAWATTGFAVNTTGSFSVDSTAGGGNWYTGSNGVDLEFTQSYTLNSTNDININVTRATIYPPFLQFKWDDSVYSTGSLSVLSNSTSTVTITNNKGKYPDVGKQRFRISAKPKYPIRSFTTSSIYLTNYALPSGSYWGLRDENTEEMVVDFDTDFTKISCDSTGPFFDVYMDGLQPERYYRILVKTELDGSTTVVDNQNIFKVVRNG
jgi:hypothetical protein